MNEIKNYRIKRFFKDGNRTSEPPDEEMTLAEAREHCAQPNTEEPGVWFDGYEKIDDDLP